MNTEKQSAVPWWLTTVLVVLFLASLSLLNYGNYQSGQQLWEVAVNSILLSIPLALLYFSIGVLIMAARQRKSPGQISERLAKYIYWTPRIAGVLIILFVAMFALDVFSEGGNFWEMLGGFVMHAMPAIIMGVVLALAWRRESIGFFAFLLAAIFFLRVLLRNPLQQLGTVLLFSAPMAAIAMLFWANWKWKKETRAR